MKHAPVASRPFLPAKVASPKYFTHKPVARDKRSVCVAAVGGFAPDVWEQVGFAVGTLALTATIFVAVSYLELQKKIAEQTEAGEDVYELKVDKYNDVRGARNTGPPETLVQRAVTKKGRKKKGGKLATSSAAAPGFRVGSQKDAK